MRGWGLVRAVALNTTVVLAAGGSAHGWSILDEVTVFDPNLAAEVVWELTDSKTYCQSAPSNLDRLACRINEVDEFWIGVDAAGNRYGVIVVVEPLGDFFDIYRQPAGTNFHNQIVRIVKRTEPVPGQVTKLLSAGRWEVDVVAGELLIGLQGQCLDPDCTAEGDTGEHLAVLRITGLPALLEIVNSYAPSGTLSFTIPRHPEGLPAADRYDVYAGDVSTLPDLAQAQPLDCDAAGAAAIGERVPVSDPLPPPAAGAVRYYVTTVTRGTDTRAGRRNQGGVHSGRSTGGLAPCTSP